MVFWRFCKDIPDPMVDDLFQIPDSEKSIYPLVMTNIAMV